MLLIWLHNQRFALISVANNHSGQMGPRPRKSLSLAFINSLKVLRIFTLKTTLVYIHMAMLIGLIKPLKGFCAIQKLPLIAYKLLDAGFVDQ